MAKCSIGWLPARYVFNDGADPDDIWAVRSAGIDPSNGKELFYAKDGSYTYDFSTAVGVRNHHNFLHSQLKNSHEQTTNHTTERMGNE